MSAPAIRRRRRESDKKRHDDEYRVFEEKIHDAADEKHRHRVDYERAPLFHKTPPPDEFTALKLLPGAVLLFHGRKISISVHTVFKLPAQTRAIIYVSIYS